MHINKKAISESLNGTTSTNNSLEEDWSKGLSFTFKITTDSLQNAFKNGSVRVGGQNKTDLSSMYGSTSLRFKIVDKPYSWANDGYMNVDRNESELRVNLYDKDFTYKDIGGKSNFNKAKLTQEMEELKNSIKNDLKDAGLVITQSKVEVGGSPKFDTAWRQAQKYNEDLDLSNDEDFDTYSKFNSDLYNAMSDVVYDYSSKGISKKDIEKAVEWFLTHFFDDYEEDEHLGESKSTNEDKLVDKLKFKDTKYEGSRTATFSTGDDFIVTVDESTEDDGEVYYTMSIHHPRDRRNNYSVDVGDWDDLKSAVIAAKEATDLLNGESCWEDFNDYDDDELVNTWLDSQKFFVEVGKVYIWVAKRISNKKWVDSKVAFLLSKADRDHFGFNKYGSINESKSIKEGIDGTLNKLGGQAAFRRELMAAVNAHPGIEDDVRKLAGMLYGRYEDVISIGELEDAIEYMIDDVLESTESVNSSYSPDLLNDLVNYYRSFDTMSYEEIWDEIVAKYNNEDLANDVIESLDNDEEDSEDEFLGESKSINEAARNKNSHKYFALMSYDFDPESGPDADRFSVSDVGQFSSKKEAEDNWRYILSKDRWAYVTEISEDEYNDHQELIKFYNEHPGYMDYEYCTKVVNQFKDALRSKDQEGARAARKELSSIGYSNEEISAIKKEVLKEAFNADRVQKRIACTTEFDNGHVFHNDYFRASSAEAEEMARQKSIENPGKVFYVKYDNVMEPCSDIKWKNGQKINEYTENLDKDAVFTKNRYDDKIYYHGFMDKKDADRHYPDRLKTKTYWYSTRHGVMPGSVPKGINILDVRDIGNKSYFKTDSIISSKDLKYYDIKEDIPPMEESKRSLKKHSRLLKENAYIKTFKLGDPEFENLYKLADILTKKSPNKYIYYVGDTYFDLGQDWMWTTVLCRGDWSSYQALNPREQEEAILAKSDAELEKIADSVLSDKYCPDKKRISEDAIADKIKANQDTKEMTKRAIQILKKKGAEYKDLEKEYEKIYGDKLIFDEK